MKSVLHFGIEAPNYSSKGMEKGFKEAGFTGYHFFPWQQVRFSEGIIGCQSRMIAAANMIKPDLIFLHLQNPEIMDEVTAIELSKCGFTVNYTFDVRGPEQTEWYYEMAPHFGLNLFGCQEDVDEGIRRGINNVGHLHSSCDIDLYKPLSLPAHTKGEYPEIVFISNNYLHTNLSFQQAQERLDMVNFMREMFGDRFGSYGMGWSPGSKMVDATEEIKIYNSAKIVLTQNNFLRTKYCSDRQWRSMACGALTICQYYEGLNEDIPIDSLPFWKTFDDLNNQCNKFLNNHHLAVEMANKQNDNLLKNHTWKNRVLLILDMIKG